MRKFEKLERMFFCVNFLKKDLLVIFFLGPNTLIAAKDCVDFQKFTSSHDFENELHKFLRIEM